MRDTDNDNAAQTHSDTGPDWGDPKVPFVEYSCDDGHDHNIVSKCPKQVNVDEKISFFEHSDQS